MAIGVYVAGGDESLVDAVALAVERDDRVWLAPSPGDARVVLAAPDALSQLADQMRDATALVVLASADAIGAARAALRAGAEGILSWPDDAPNIGARLGEAAARKVVARADGCVIAVVAARGGAGATTIAAHLVAGTGAILLDARGGPAGQVLYAREAPSFTLATAGANEATQVSLRRAAAQHASGAQCVFGGADPIDVTQPLIDCALGLAPVVVVDGPASHADATVLVLGPDVGSVRSAADMLPRMTGRVEVVLNRAGGGRVRARTVRRALGVGTVRMIPADRTLARAADYGRIARRGPGRRAIRRLARELLAGDRDAG